MTELQLMHEIARARFKDNRSKCYQRHIREVWGEAEQRLQLPSRSGARVERVTRDEAASIILKYEWLQSMGRGVQACYGLKLKGELIGANCFGSMGGKVGDICGPLYAKQTACLMRGACAPHAPKNAASFLTRHACRQAHKDFGWQIFFAYSDTSEASEMGVVYQACNWFYLGEGLGAGKHYDYEAPDGSRTITSYRLNHDKKNGSRLMKSLGWTEQDGERRPWLRSKGWKPITRHEKKKWVWFEGSARDRASLRGLCRHPVMPYPKKSADQELQTVITVAQGLVKARKQG